MPNTNKPSTQINNPLHGISLENIVTQLVATYGWEELGNLIKIKCFSHEPSIKSSLKFLRKTPWARDKVEQLFLRSNNVSVSTPSQIKNKKIKIEANNGQVINPEVWG